MQEAELAIDISCALAIQKTETCSSLRGNLGITYLGSDGSEEALRCAADVYSGRLRLGRRT